MATACSSYACLPCRTHRTFSVRVLDQAAALGKVLPWAPLGPASPAAFALPSVPAGSSLQPPAFTILRPIGRCLTARSPGDTSHSPKNCLPVPRASDLSETGDRPLSLPSSANHLWPRTKGFSTPCKASPVSTWREMEVLPEIQSALFSYRDPLNYFSIAAITIYKNIVVQNNTLLQF